MTFVATAFTTGFELGRLWAGLMLVIAGAVAIGFGIWLVRRRRTPDVTPDVTPDPSTDVTPDVTPDDTVPDFAPDAAAEAPADAAEVSMAQPSSGTGRRTGGIVLLVVGALLVGVGLIRTIPTVADDLSHQSVTLPETAGDLHRVEASPQMQQLLENMPSQLASVGAITNAQAGAYAEGDSSEPVAYIIAAEIAGAPNAEEFFQGAAAEFEQTNSGITLEQADTAGQGGEMRCTDLPNSVGLCLWLDSDTLGVVIRGPGASQSTVDLANTLRDATEN